jgi:hypothetical protein
MAYEVSKNSDFAVAVALTNIANELKCRNDLEEAKLCFPNDCEDAYLTYEALLERKKK